LFIKSFSFKGFIYFFIILSKSKLSTTSKGVIFLGAVCTHCCPVVSEVDIFITSKLSGILIGLDCNFLTVEMELPSLSNFCIVSTNLRLLGALLFACINSQSSSSTWYLF